MVDATKIRRLFISWIIFSIITLAFIFPPLANWYSIIIAFIWFIFSNIVCGWPCPKCGEPNGFSVVKDSTIVITYMLASGKCKHCNFNYLKKSTV